MFGALRTYEAIEKQTQGNNSASSWGHGRMEDGLLLHGQTLVVIISVQTSISITKTSKQSFSIII
jgi:hypothetical protein